MASPTGTDSLSYLPEFRKRIGRREHLRIYRKIAGVFDDPLALNRLVGGIFPAGIGRAGRHLFYEVDLCRRVPDCVVVFRERDGSAACYVLEFKTTMGVADGESLRANRTHRLQYLQGLRQLRDSLVVFSQFSVGGHGPSWRVYPVIVFYKQRGVAPTVVRVFRPREYRVAGDAVVDFLRGRQHPSVKALSRFSLCLGVRGARQKRAALLFEGDLRPPAGRRRAAPAAAGRGSRPRRPSAAAGRAGRRGAGRGAAGRV
ncbi:pR76 [rat cytomegalovirus strain Maastricht]|uniref:PR76 n=1 Tax=Rat cytomegalovirus (strain Maastricht) TaxID=79700 RepID=Q9DWC4_RCMVM|nr:pR76 [rat cytomegalovirus strain Maastricht]AAF99166.1 pR76 [rat cytomegalovirus strain Maastricht]WEG71997.1 nuclear protein UL24 [Murid betaherpesvirus 2]